MGITQKIDNVTGIKPEQLKLTPPAPIACKIELTGRCNYKCSYCAHSQGLRKIGDMDWHFYLALLDDLKASGVHEVGLFFLGESFILPWLPRAVAAAKDKGFNYVFLTTNGSLSTPEVVEKCMRAGLDSLKFSMNYSDAWQFHVIARVKPSYFSKSIAHIKAAYDVRNRIGAKCGLYASYIMYDGEQGRRMQALVEEIRPYLDEVYALPLYNQAALVLEAEKLNGWDVKAGNPGRYENMRQPVPCWALFTEARVTWDGKLSACCFSHDDRFDMADLSRTRFMDGWHSETFRHLRDAHIRKQLEGTACEKCVAWG